MNTARQIYNLIKDDDDCVAHIRATALQLAMDCADPDKALETTSFTLNGQSGAGSLRMDKAALLDLLTKVLWMVTNTASLSTRVTRVSFPS